MKMAQIQASLSYAFRLKVGAVIMIDGRPISSGRNGCVAGGSNFCEFTDTYNGELKTKPEVIHAEANAILWAARKGTALEGSELYITHSPCFECCKMIAQSGIKEVYYRTQFRDISGLEFLRKNNIKVEQLI